MTHCVWKVDLVLLWSWMKNKMIYHIIIHRGRDLWRSPVLKCNQLRSCFPGISYPSFNISKDAEIPNLSGILFQCMATFTGDFFSQMSKWSLCGCNLYTLLLFAQSWLHFGSTSPLQTCPATTGLCLPLDPCWLRHCLACIALTLGSGVTFPYRAAHSPRHSTRGI